MLMGLYIYIHLLSMLPAGILGHAAWIELESGCPFICGIWRVERMASCKMRWRERKCSLTFIKRIHWSLEWYFPVCCSMIGGESPLSFTSYTVWLRTNYQFEVGNLPHELDMYILHVLFRFLWSGVHNIDRKVACRREGSVCWASGWLIFKGQHASPLLCYVGVVTRNPHGRHFQ